MSTRKQDEQVNENVTQADRRERRINVRTPTHVHRQHRQHQDLEHLNLKHIWHLVKVNRLIVGSTVLAAVSVALLHAFFAVPEFHASSALGVTVSNPYKSVPEFAAGVADDGATSKMNSLSEYFRSPEVAERIFKSVEETNQLPLVILSQGGWKRTLVTMGFLSPSYFSSSFQNMPHYQLVAEVMYRLRVSSNPANNTMIIESASADPRLSAFLANRAAEALVEINQKISMRKLLEVKSFLNMQADDLGLKLKSLENELTEFQSRNQIISIDDAEHSVHASLDANEQKLVEAQINLDTNEKFIGQVEKELIKIRDNVDKPEMSSSNLYLPQLQHRLSMLQYQKALAQNSNTGTPAEMQELQGEIDRVVNSYKGALTAQGQVQDMGFMSPLEYYQSLTQSLGTLKKDRKKLASDLEILKQNIHKRKGEIPKLALTHQRLTEIKRNIQLTTDLYLAIKRKLQETEIQEAGMQNDVSILSRAAVPTVPFAVPLSLKLIFSFVVGMFFGLLIILLREAVIPTIRDRHDLEREGLVVLGEVPLADLETEIKDVVIIHDFPTSFEADVFRSIRLRFESCLSKHFPKQHTGAQVILVTSPRPGDGKSFTSVNFSATLAKAHQRTLLIDLDLRKPSVKSYFPNLEQSAQGIDSLMRDPGIKSNDIICTAAPGFDLILGWQGHATNPAEFIESAAFDELLRSQRDKYDYIIIDAPPVLGVVDASLVAPQVDVVLLVIEYRKTRREDIMHAEHILRDVYSKPFLGLVNCVSTENSYYDYYYQQRPTPKSSHTA